MKYFLFIISCVLLKNPTAIGSDYVNALTKPRIQKRLRRRKHRSDARNRRTGFSASSRRNKKSIVKWKIAPRQPETRRADVQDTKIWPCDPRLRNSFVFGRGRTAQSTDFISRLSWYQRAECWQKWPVDSHQSVGWVTDWWLLFIGRFTTVLHSSFCCRAPAFASFFQLWSQLIQRSEFIFLRFAFPWKLFWNQRLSGC